MLTTQKNTATKLIGGYRYSYQGYEGDSEVKGTGNSYTTEFRQYDPRLGRWLSTDPMMSKFPWQSPYVAFNNNPVLYSDPSGGESEDKGKRLQAKYDRKYNKWLDKNYDPDIPNPNPTYRIQFEQSVTQMRWFQNYRDHMGYRSAIGANYEDQNIVEKAGQFGSTPSWSVYVDFPQAEFHIDASAMGIAMTDAPTTLYTITVVITDAAGNTLASQSWQGTSRTLNPGDPSAGIFNQTLQFTTPDDSADGNKDGRSQINVNITVTDPSGNPRGVSLNFEIVPVENKIQQEEQGKNRNFKWLRFSKD